MWHWGTYFLFLFSVLVSYFCLKQYDICKRREKIEWLLIGLLPTFLLMALRGEYVGQDLINYADNVENARYFLTGDASYALSEPFFNLIYWVAYILGGIKPFIVLTSFIQYFFLFVALRTFYRHKIDTRLIFILFFAVISIRSFSMVRNGVAIACSLCAYANLLGDLNISKRRKYWFYSFLALGFHNTALINIPIYWICSPISGEKKYSKISMFFRISLMLTFLFIAFSLEKLGLIDLFYTINEGKYASFEVESEVTGWGNLLVRLPLLFLIVVLFRLLRKEFGQNVFPFVLLVCFDIVVAQLKYLNQNFERFIMYTNIGEILVLGMMCIILSKRSKGYRILFLFVGLAYYTFFMYRWAVQSEYGIMPYETWIE